MRGTKCLCDVNFLADILMQKKIIIHLLLSARVTVLDLILRMHFNYGQRMKLNTVEYATRLLQRKSIRISG